MSRAIVIPGADASASGFPAVSLGDFDIAVGRIPGLIHLLDPEQVPGYAVNGTSAKTFKDRVRGRPLRASPTSAPITATEGGVANSKTLFDASGVTECSLTAQDATYPADGSMTFITLARPVPASIDGSTAAFLLRGLQGATGHLTFRTTTGGTPQLLLQDETIPTGVLWTFGSALVAGTPAVLAFTIDAPSKTLKIYCNDGSASVASSVVASVGAYANTHFTFGGAKLSAGSWRGRFGRTALWSRALTQAEMSAAMDAWRAYYGVTI